MSEDTEPKYPFLPLSEEVEQGDVAALTEPEILAQLHDLAKAFPRREPGGKYIVALPFPADE